MKNLKQLLVIGAVMSAMNFAKGSEGAEKVFEPTEKSGEIDKIELVNGQLLVRAPGAKIQGVETPYVYVGTNTTNFASNGFAQGGLQNVDKYVHVGDGKIYMTEKGNNKQLWEANVKAPSAALNGVVTGVKEVTENAEALIAGLEATNQDKTTVKFENDTYVIDTKNGQVIKNGISSKDFIGSLTEVVEVKDVVFLKGIQDGEPTNIPFILGKNAAGNTKVYNSLTTIVPAEEVLSVDNNAKIVIRQKDGAVKVYKQGGAWTPISQISNVNANDPIKSVTASNGIIYYATAKKIGWCRE